MRKITIAIDGFSSCGKSTMAKQLALQIGYIYIDSGAMYRAVTLLALRSGWITETGIDILKLEKALNTISIQFKSSPTSNTNETYLNGENVERDIRTLFVANAVSQISAIPSVRHKLVELQQAYGIKGGIVMDGRDIGTVVFPNAELKIFVTASAEIRAERRLLELKAKGDNTISLQTVLKNIEERDYADQNRKESPLRKAADALILDNSSLTPDEQLEWLKQYYLERCKSK